MFCQFSVGGQLTAEYRQQRCFAVFIMDIKGVITGNGLRRVGLIITQRTHTGVGPDDIVTAKLFFKVRVIHFQQIVDFTLFNLHRFRIAFILYVGGADDGKFVHPRDHEHNTFIFVLQNVGLLLGMHARHHNMAAFDQANAIRRRQMHPVVEELFHPRAGGVNQAARLPAIFFAGIDIFRFHNPQAVFAASRGGASPSKHFAAFTHHHLGVGEYQTGVVYPTVRIFESALNFRF